jgi:MFS family permease
LDRVELWILYGVAFVLGIAETMADTAGASILPSIVPHQDLEKANSRLVGAITVTNEFIGPPLGGAIAAISLALAFATSSALYLLAALALLLLIGTFHPTKTSRPHLLTDIVAGMKYVWREPLLRTLVIIVGVMNLGWSAWLSVMVLYMVEPGPGGLSELGFGLMLTSIGIGGFLGALITVPLVNRFGRRWAIGADISGTLLMLAIPAVTANVWLIGGAAIFGGIGGSMWSIVVSSIRQQMVPDDMLGRTSGVFTLFGYGALPLGAALAGLIGEVVSIPAVFAICSGLTALLFMPFLRYITPTAIERTGALLR